MDFAELGADCHLTDVTVKIGEEEFPLHNLVMSMKCDEFKDRPRTDETIEMNDFPGGKDCFAVIVDFCYNRPIEANEKNIAELRCGAEVLKMRGEDNLITVTEERFDDMLDVAKHVRSTAIPFEILQHCVEFGEIADTARLVDRCIDTICSIWTHINFCCDVPWNKISTIPYSWFSRFLRGLTSRSNNNPLLLAEVIYRYTFQVISPNLHPKPLKRPGKSDDDNAIDPKELLDDIFASIPCRTPLTDVITPEWINRVLDIISPESKYRQKCLQLCCGVLHGKCSKAFRTLGPEKIKILLKAHKTLSELESNKLADFINEYVKDAADMKLLTMEQYIDLLKAVPRGCRLDSDAHLLTYESLVDAGYPATDEQRIDFLSKIDLAKCCDRHMKRILQKEIFPPQEICKAVFQSTNDCINGDMIGSTHRADSLLHPRSFDISDPIVAPASSCPRSNNVRRFKDEFDPTRRCNLTSKNICDPKGRVAVDIHASVSSSCRSHSHGSASLNRLDCESCKWKYPPSQSFPMEIPKPTLGTKLCDVHKKNLSTTKDLNRVFPASNFTTVNKKIISKSYKRYSPSEFNDYLNSRQDKFLFDQSRKCNEVNSCQCRRDPMCCSRYRSQ